MRITLDATCPPEAFAALLAALHSWQGDDPTILTSLHVEAPELTSEEVHTILAASPFNLTDTIVLHSQPPQIRIRYPPPSSP